MIDAAGLKEQIALSQFLRPSELLFFTSVQFGGSWCIPSAVKYLSSRDSTVIPVVLNSLPPNLLLAAAELDQKVLGGLWTESGYHKELERASSDLLGIWPLQPPAKLLSPIGPSRRSVQDAEGVAQRSTASLLAMGCAWSILDESHITLLAVQPSLQRHGFGSAMLIGLLRSAHDRGLRHATLEVRASNQAAISLYQKFGFKSLGFRPGYYSTDLVRPAEDALILWRSGLQSEDFLLAMDQHWRGIESRLQLQQWQIKTLVEKFTSAE